MTKEETKRLQSALKGNTRGRSGGLEMKGIWRFYDGNVSGIVIATNYKQALHRANEYINSHFTDGNNSQAEIQVWECSNDDDFDARCPFSLAIAY